MIRHPVLIAGVLLALFGVLGSALVAFTYVQTAERIAQNEREALLRTLNALVPPEDWDNDMVNDRILVHRRALLGDDTTTVYRARRGGTPVAAVLLSSTCNAEPWSAWSRTATALAGSTATGTRWSSITRRRSARRRGS